MQRRDHLCSGEYATRLFRGKKKRINTNIAKMAKSTPLKEQEHLFVHATVNNDVFYHTRFVYAMFLTYFFSLFSSRVMLKDSDIRLTFTCESTAAVPVTRALGSLCPTSWDGSMQVGEIHACFCVACINLCVNLNICSQLVHWNIC